MINGKKIRLRHAERADLPHFVRWLNTPDTRQYLDAIYPFSQIEEEQWFDNLLKSREAYLNFFVIETLETNEIVGTLGLHEVNQRNRWTELGIMIGDSANQNKGYGSDALRTLLRFAFEELNLNRVQLRVHDDNLRGIHVYKRCGFVHEGTLRQNLWKHGCYHDVHIMAVLRSEWK
ncbi:MAG: GNAT family protein [Chloroflexota bacterium]|jgi:RimJ/RimL family protein N-acetyltransferase